MPASAVLLVAGAAVFHATWNLITKRTGGGIAFLWLFGVFGSLVMLPFAIGAVVRMDRGLQTSDLVAIAGSGFIHVFYFSLLQNGYKAGDLSVVYPVARGLGPLLASIVGIAVLGDRPGPFAMLGGLALLAGVVGMSGISPGNLKLDHSVLLGVLTGISIACYTLWDQHSVTELDMPPVFYYWGSTVAYTLLISPLVFRAPVLPWNSTFARSHFRPALAVAVLSSISYSLVLTAMTLAPLSYVATLRESSILVATIFGVWFLGEPLTQRKAIAACLIVFGIFGLTLG
jgi:drug/metabolite transporter (DMT)-like permease